MQSHYCNSSPPYPQPGPLSSLVRLIGGAPARAQFTRMCEQLASDMASFTSPAAGAGSLPAGGASGEVAAKIMDGAKLFGPGSASTASAALDALVGLASVPPLRDAVLSSDLVAVALEAARRHPTDRDVQVRCTPKRCTKRRRCRGKNASSNASSSNA